VLGIIMTLVVDGKSRWNSFYGLLIVGIVLIIGLIFVSRTKEDLKR
jgi:hypothetical protein